MKKSQKPKAIFIHTQKDFIKHFGYPLSREALERIAEAACRSAEQNPFLVRVEETKNEGGKCKKKKR